jgi:zinc transporter ZupT
LTSTLTASLVAFGVTLVSGLLALFLRSRKSAVYASCAGALVGGAVLFLVPDALALFERSSSSFPVWLVWLTGLAALSLFYALERSHHELESTRLAGWGGAIGLAIHSFIDGVVIGQGFRAGDETGFVLALAVMLHRMADGASAVGVMLGTEHSLLQTSTMLFVTALAPVLGAAAQAFVELPAPLLSLLIAFFAGMLFYLGTRRLLPEALRATKARMSVPAFFAAGFAVVYAAYLLAN